ncbi:M20 metallopeptidase family protein [Paenibacillus physcomitrellae]|uniref:Amidohydrolase YhaA n=1 Tax=Paenibacillus physcomitrellae TaxID=1619311 RepID=A0ABQ1FNI6_9BACL|nr:M20 family metallopeptidase [Paenibacillus physcomitrellae]GGA21698.1 putative amidohydrolase YhaA [Paenibacillus physcomitrellae]
MGRGEIEHLYPVMVERRRYLHRHPELSYQEQATSAYIADVLNKAGIEHKTQVGGHGVVGIIKGSRPGPVVALRADMDALPIQDEKEVEYKSEVPGIMHACGHDGHTAVLLGVAEYFAARREQIQGEIRLLFQPAEEVCPGGALPMIKDGALDGVDVVYGVHLWTPIPVGTAASAPGPMMASTDEFFVNIHGRGGHGGMPHKTVDSVVVGSAMVMQLQSIVSRSVNPLDPAVVTIGSFQAGTVQNVIAERARLAGTVRCFSETARKLIQKRIASVVEFTAQSYEAEVVLEYIPGYPTLVNDETETNRFFKVAGQLEGLKTELTPPIMPAEDFAYYLQQVPGCFILVGAGNPEKGAEYPHHHPKFDLDEEAMAHAAAILISLTENYMDEWEPK